MHWNRDGSGMLVFDHHVMATLHTIQAESKLLKGSYGLLPIHGGGTRHLANSDKLLKRRQSCGARGGPLSVSLLCFEVAPHHFRRVVESLQFGFPVRGHAMKLLDVCHERVALLIELHVNCDRLGCRQRVGHVRVRIWFPQKSLGCLLLSRLPGLIVDENAWSLDDGSHVRTVLLRKTDNVEPPIGRHMNPRLPRRIRREV